MITVPSLDSARDLFWRLRLGYLHHKPGCSKLKGEFECSCGLGSILLAMRAFE